MITNPVKVIRAKCLDCSNDSKVEVANCPIVSCPLYEWRFGKNPYRKKRELTEEEKQAIKERFSKSRKEKEA